MKRQSTLANKLHGDSTASNTSYNRASYEDSNPYVYNYSPESEPISEQSRKIQKKRDTYQKIPDDVRVQILESVQGGETLKSAAKRFGINYSSAKSILHTYRKEGRILKKSAQDRTMKKKGSNTTHDEDSKPEKQTTKVSKKETVKNAKTVAPLVERTTSASTCASFNEEKSSPVQNQESLTMKMEQYEAQHQVHQDYTSPLEGFNRGARQTGGMPMDGYYMKYADYHYPEMGGDYYRNEVPEYANNMHFSASEFDPISVLQPRLPKNEEAYHNTNAFFYQKGFNAPENGLYYEENLENAGNPLKSFMDSQLFLQEALKKTNFWTGSGNQGFRKSSFDMF